MSHEGKKKEILKELEEIESQLSDWKCIDKESLYDESYNAIKIVFEKRKNVSKSVFLSYTVIFNGNSSLKLPIFDCVITIGIVGGKRSFWEEFSFINHDKSENLTIEEILSILNSIDKFENPENNLKTLFNRSIA